MEKVGRNDPCPCGSGLKFKKCHGANTGTGTSLPTDSIEVSESGKKSGWLNYPARSYQRFIESFPLPKDVGFWTGCVRQFGSPVLCLCCGIGREAFYLAEQGIEVVGVDLNEGIVKLAEEKRLETEQSRKLALHFRQADVVRMKLDRQFPIALMATQSFQLLLTESDQRAFLTTLAKHLSDKGTFVFNLTKVSHQGNKFLNHKGEVIGTYAMDFDRQPRFLSHGPLYQRLSTLEEVRGLLDQNGFEVLKVLGKSENIPSDFGQKDVSSDNDDDEVTVVARKK